MLALQTLCPGEIVDHTPLSMVNLVPVRSVQLPRITSSNIFHLECEVGLDQEVGTGQAAHEGGPCQL